MGTWNPAGVPIPAIRWRLPVKEFGHVYTMA